MNQEVNDAVMVYVTCQNGDEARAIATDLLTKRLVACANIMAGHKAVYHWEGRIEESDETILLLKSQAHLFDRIRDRICDMHSYDCPCILAFSACAGHSPFLEWLQSEVKA